MLLLSPLMGNAYNLVTVWDNTDKKEQTLQLKEEGQKDILENVENGKYYNPMIIVGKALEKPVHVTLKAPKVDKEGNVEWPVHVARTEFPAVPLFFFEEKGLQENRDLRELDPAEKMVFLDWVNPALLCMDISNPEEDDVYRHIVIYREVNQGDQRAPLYFSPIMAALTNPKDWSYRGVSNYYYYRQYDLKCGYGKPEEAIKMDLSSKDWERFCGIHAVNDFKVKPYHYVNFSKSTKSTSFELFTVKRKSFEGNPGADKVIYCAGAGKQDGMEVITLQDPSKVEGDGFYELSWTPQQGHSQATAIDGNNTVKEAHGLLAMTVKDLNNVLVTKVKFNNGATYITYHYFADEKTVDEIKTALFTDCGTKDSAKMLPADKAEFADYLAVYARLNIIEPHAAFDVSIHAPNGNTKVGAALPTDAPEKVPATAPAKNQIDEMLDALKTQIDAYLETAAGFSPIKALKIEAEVENIETRLDKLLEDAGELNEGPVKKEATASIAEMKKALEVFNDKERTQKENLGTIKALKEELAKQEEEVAKQLATEAPEKALEKAKEDLLKKVEELRGFSKDIKDSDLFNELTKELNEIETGAKTVKQEGVQGLQDKLAEIEKKIRSYIAEHQDDNDGNDNNDNDENDNDGNDDINNDDDENDNQIGAQAQELKDKIDLLIKQLKPLKKSRHSDVKNKDQELRRRFSKLAGSIVEAAEMKNEDRFEKLEEKLAKMEQEVEELLQLQEFLEQKKRQADQKSTRSAARHRRPRTTRVPTMTAAEQKKYEAEQKRQKEEHEKTLQLIAKAQNSQSSKGTSSVNRTRKKHTAPKSRRFLANAAEN